MISIIRRRRRNKRPRMERKRSKHCHSRSQDSPKKKKESTMKHRFSSPLYYSIRKRAFQSLKLSHSQSQELMKSKSKLNLILKDIKEKVAKGSKNHVFIYL